jgi:hypothetical protein
MLETARRHDRDASEKDIADVRSAILLTRDARKCATRA